MNGASSGETKALLRVGSAGTEKVGEQGSPTGISPPIRRDRPASRTLPRQNHLETMPRLRLSAGYLPAICRLSAGYLPAICRLSDCDECQFLARFAEQPARWLLHPDGHRPLRRHRFDRVGNGFTYSVKKRVADCEACGAPSRRSSVVDAAGKHGEVVRRRHPPSHRHRASPHPTPIGAQGWCFAPGERDGWACEAIDDFA
jgi:hypothetical protein